MAPGSVPGVAPTRYRCAACGNLTRFDVVTDRRTRAFHHYSVGGDLTVEDEEVLSEDVVEITCRWCGHGSAVEAIDDDGDPDRDPVSQPSDRVSASTTDGEPSDR